LRAAPPPSKLWIDVQGNHILVKIKDGYASRLRIFDGKKEGNLLLISMWGSWKRWKLTASREFKTTLELLGVYHEDLLATEYRFLIAIENCWITIE